jgi:biotin carboxyl carrier protein
MIFEIAIGDKLRTVGIVRKGGLLHVDLDGRTHVVDARRISDSIVSMLVQSDGASAPSRSVDAAFASQQAAGDFDVHLDGLTIPVQIRPAGAFGRQKKSGPGATATGPQRVTSPMPGKVVRVLVKPGDEVKARQGLVVVEAMKMENELRAARDGRVKDVAVAEGQSVDAGTILLVVE